MENAAYVGLSRQMTLRRELDIVANNIANADTTGFKVEQLLLGEEVGERARNAFVRPGVSFVIDNGVGRDFGRGALEQTGRTLDFAIEGPQGNELLRVYTTRPDTLMGVSCGVVGLIITTLTLGLVARRYTRATSLKMAEEMGEG